MNDAQKDSFAVFHINGTPEKDLIGTCVVNSIKEQNPNKKIIVTTNFPEIWLHNPDVWRVYKLGHTPYFHDDFIKDKNTDVFANDPYLESDYIYQTKPLAEIWCKMIGVKHNGSKPKIYLTQREKEVTERLLTADKSKKILIAGNDLFPPNEKIIYNWTKDLPIYISQQVANAARAKGYKVIQIRLPNQPPIEGAITLNLNFRLTLAALKIFDKCLLIDSYLQHAAVAIEKPSVVTWLSGNPDIKSYEMHTNIKGEITPAIKEDLENFNHVFDIVGKMVSKPKVMEGVYSVDKIIKALEL